MASSGSSCCSDLLAALLASAVLAAPAELRTRPIEYADLPPPARSRLAARGIDNASRFEEERRRIDATTAERLRQGERDSLVYYALQSQRFTDAPRIEPALSAREFIEHLPDAERRRLLDDPAYLPAATLPTRERDRIRKLLQAIRSPSTAPWLVSLRDFTAAQDGSVSADAFYPDYVRVARFLYRKEFVATADASSASTATSRLYQDRAHSSDTRIEAGFGVSVGLASLRALDPALRLPRALVVGPGLDFAPRTDLIDTVGPQSYQPFAVADALLSLSLASSTDLRVESVDINSRVVDWFHALVPDRVTLHFLTGIRADRALTLRDDYQAYLRSLGRMIGDETSAPRGLASDAHYVRSIAVRPAIVRALGATRLNVLTGRIAGEPRFDLVIVTNVLAYFNDAELDLALANIGAMLRPGGYLLHNESRDGLAEQATALGLPAVHMRTAVIGGPSDRPLYDAVWIHRRSAAP